MAKIGQRIRELRRRRSLSARELAARSGISHSTISLMERDRLSPSIDTLGAVLEALGTTLPAFFSDGHYGPPYSPFYKSDQFIEIGRPETISYRVVGLNHPNRQILLLHETYMPGADTGKEFSHDAQEGGIVISGEIELTVGNETRILTAGDGYYFDSRKPHRFRNIAEGKSEILSAINPPTY